MIIKICLITAGSLGHSELWIRIVKMNPQSILHYIDGLMQKRPNSIDNALESCLFCIKLLMYSLEQ